MQYITTTDLRTKSPELITLLKSRSSVSLIHRSHIIGVIQPVQQQAKGFDPSVYTALVAHVKPNTLVPRENRTTLYQQELKKKYGKNLS